MKTYFDQEDGWGNGGRILLEDIGGGFVHLKVTGTHPRGEYLSEAQRKNLITALEKTVTPEPKAADPTFKSGDRVRLVHDDDGYVGLPAGVLGTVHSGPDMDDEYRVNWDGGEFSWDYTRVDQLALIVPETASEETASALVARIKAARVDALRLDQDTMAEGLGGVLVFLSMFGAKV